MYANSLGYSARRRRAFATGIATQLARAGLIRKSTPPVSKYTPGGVFFPNRDTEIPSTAWIAGPVPPAYDVGI
jgi:hypothetical protein